MPAWLAFLALVPELLVEQAVCGGVPVTATQLERAYRNVKREPRDGTLMEAIRVHAQACGLVAFVFDTHPDRVAEAVRDALTTPERVSAEATTE